MRWRYVYDPDPAELAERDRMLTAIEEWWRAFTDRADQLDAHYDQGAPFEPAIPHWMEATLGRVSPHLMWEFGPDIEKPGHRLAISEEGRHELGPLVEVVLARAPALPRWQFLHGRPPETADQVIRSLQGRCSADVSGVLGSVQRGSFNTIDVLLHSPHWQAVGEKSAAHTAMITMEYLLGEQMLDRWIGVVEAAPMPGAGAGVWEKFRTRWRKDRRVDPPPRLIPLDRLRPTIEALKTGIIDQLPSEPVGVLARSATAEWSLLKLQSPMLGVEDPPRREDLIVATTANVPIWNATLRARLFRSERFSRCDETFAYLKIDGRDQDRSTIAEYRGRIDDAVQNALDDAGGVWGGGTGERYVYTEVALRNVDVAVGRIHDALRTLDVPRKAWLLFHDVDLADEWVGVWPESPPPPRADRD